MDGKGKDSLVIALYGGPYSGRKVKLKHHNIAFLRAGKGHYARVSGGLSNKFYYYDCSVPMAVDVNGFLIPVGEYKSE